MAKKLRRSQERAGLFRVQRLHLLTVLAALAAEAQALAQASHRVRREQTQLDRLTTRKKDVDENAKCCAHLAAAGFIEPPTPALTSRGGDGPLLGVARKEFENTVRGF
jgi:hypothetical protein